MDFSLFKEVFESSKMDFILSHAMYCRDVLKLKKGQRAVISNGRVRILSWDKLGFQLDQCPALAALSSEGRRPSNRATLSKGGAADECWWLFWLWFWRCAHVDMCPVFAFVLPWGKAVRRSGSPNTSPWDLDTGSTEPVARACSSAACVHAAGLGLHSLRLAALRWERRQWWTNLTLHLCFGFIIYIWWELMKTIFFYFRVCLL